jgi:hypothetical protein
MKKLPIVVSVLTLILAGCGGSSAPGGGGSPAPAPAPAPTPTPTPTPTVTTRVFGSSLAAALIDFTDGNFEAVGLFTALGFTARDGRYSPGFANAIAAYTGLGTSPGASLQNDYSLFYKQIRAVDHETGILIEYDSPANFIMATPVTSMLVVNGTSEAKVEQQLGITGGPLALTVNPNLSTYDAIQEIESGEPARVADGERMLAANLRAMTLWVGLKATVEARAFLSPSNFNVLYSDNRAVPPGAPFNPTSAFCMRERPAEFVFERATLVAMIACYTQSPVNGYVPPTGVRAEAIAHVISTYARAIPARLTTRAERARWLLGLRGYLVPLIGQIYNAPDDSVAQSALTITQSTVVNETSIYENHLRYNETGRFMPGPDFVTLRSGTAISYSIAPIVNNDYVLSNEKVNTRGIDLAATRIIRLESAPDNTNKARTVLVLIGPNGSEFTTTASPDFKGATYFDYFGRASNGEERLARVYIRVF